MHAVGPTLELSEYHWFHREKVELYMAELYNKIGTAKNAAHYRLHLHCK